MGLLRALNHYSRQRQGWFLLTLIMLALLAAAAYFQHVMLLAPCVMCIYERVATIGVAFAGAIGLINPKKAFLRWVGLLLWASSSAKGLLLSYQHVGFQNDTTGLVTCDILPNFPSWAPLHQWLPSYFYPTGDCSEIAWAFLSISMPQWLIIIFAISSLASLFIIVSQFIPKKATINHYNISG